MLEESLQLESRTPPATAADADGTASAAVEPLALTQTVGPSGVEAVVAVPSHCQPLVSIPDATHGRPAAITEEGAGATEAAEVRQRQQDLFSVLAAGPVSGPLPALSADERNAPAKPRGQRPANRKGQSGPRTKSRLPAHGAGEADPFGVVQEQQATAARAALSREAACV